MEQTEIRRFRRALRQFERLNAYQLKNCCTEVTFAQCLVLLEVDEAGHPSMGELAAKLRLDNSTLSRTIDGLVRKGMVDRQGDETDRRTVRIVLTAEGKNVCGEIHRDSDACVLRLFDKIAPSRHQTVIRNFETLVEAFLEWEVEVTEPGGCDRLQRAPEKVRTR